MTRIGLFEPTSSQCQGSDREMLLLHQYLWDAKIKPCFGNHTPYATKLRSRNRYWLSGCEVTLRRV
jgi:hypothetical protein